MAPQPRSCTPRGLPAWGPRCSAGDPALPRWLPVDPKAPPKFLIFCDIVNDQLDPYLGSPVKTAAAVEYLKVLAISRLYLSNFKNVQSSWVTQGLKVCQLGLRFGGNDVGSVMLEENVVRAAGVTNCTTEEELRRIIREAGFKPVQRDTLYRTYFLN